jgi:hypothetical protein
MQITKVFWHFIQTFPLALKEVRSSESKKEREASEESSASYQMKPIFTQQLEANSRVMLLGDLSKYPVCDNSKNWLLYSRAANLHTCNYYMNNRL